MLDKEITEKQFSQYVVDLARTLGWLVYRTHDSRRSPKGFPDLVMVYADPNKPRFELVFAELKTMRGELSPEQRQWYYALDFVSDGSAGKREGGWVWPVKAFVWRPCDEDEIFAVLTGESYFEHETEGDA